MNQPVYPIHSVLAVVAHPDDAEFMCGGTLARMASEGKEVNVVVVTSGEKGGDGTVAEQDLAQTRESEERTSAALLGVKEVIFLRGPDGSVLPSLELRREIVRQVRLHKPDLVITHNPVRHFGHGAHPDHLAVGEATLAAVDPTSGNPMAYPEMAGEGTQAWPVDWVLVFDAADPNHYEDVGGTIAVKIDALTLHRSQPTAQAADAIRWIGREHARQAQVSGRSGLEYAEAFRRVFTGPASRMRTEGHKVPA
jgi:LmbE family N-acetylglucosaminyl deacetylase